MYLFLVLLSATQITASCVTFQELIESPSSFTCTRNDTIGQTSSVCTLCQRKCPQAQPDCVWILGENECPAAMPSAGSRCTTNHTCAFEPYCGSVFVEGGREICMFLASGECVNNEWLISIVSRPNRNPTCNEVKNSYRQQSCCTHPENEFELNKL